MLQKKVCMVGVFSTGKTCLVQRYVHSIFSARYLSTVGVKIDRKTVAVDGTDVNLLLWDLEGRDGEHDVSTSYLRGAHGIIYVIDGTRRETFEQIFELRDLVRRAVGDVPSIVALNKIDLTDEWSLGAADDKALSVHPWHPIRTSAKTGEGVEDAFAWLARATLAPGGGKP
jgi:small GTP-binding protein